MEGGGIGRRRRWKNLKQKLGFNGMGCCGSSWGFGVPTQMSVGEEEEGIQEEEEEESETMTMGNENPTVVRHLPMEEECLGQNQIPSTTGMMNLATALAAERQFRASEGASNGTTTPLKISLMRMLEEGDGEEEEEEGNGGVVQLLSCCVCMERRKGAAFIPCGHTFCRVCSRELWLNRGSCPLCNRSILDILDIF